MIFGEKCQGWKVQCTLSLPTGNSQEKHHLLPRNKKKKVWLHSFIKGFIVFITCIWMHWEYFCCSVFCLKEATFIYTITEKPVFLCVYGKSFILDQFQE